MNVVYLLHTYKKHNGELVSAYKVGRTQDVYKRIRELGKKNNSITYTPIGLVYPDSLKWNTKKLEKNLLRMFRSVDPMPINLKKEMFPDGWSEHFSELLGGAIYASFWGLLGINSFLEDETFPKCNGYMMDFDEHKSWVKVVDGIETLVSDEDIPYFRSKGTLTYD